MKKGLCCFSVLAIFIHHSENKFKIIDFVENIYKIKIELKIYKIGRKTLSTKEFE